MKTNPMKTKFKTQKTFIRTVSHEKLDVFLEKIFGQTYENWHMEKENLYHVTGELDFLESFWNDFKQVGRHDGLNANVILNGLASEGRIPKGIYFIV